MAVASETSQSDPYTLSSASATLTVPFYFMSDTDLVVTRTRSSVVTILVLDSDYTVTGHGDTNGGSITVAGQASGDVIVISRTVPMTQERTFVPVTALSETNIEAGLDKCTMMAQQLRRDLDVLSSATIEEAPIDGTSYARKDAGWVALPDFGDMFKSVYDTDNDGKVDAAEVADSATYATTAGTATTAVTISGSITISQVTNLSSELSAKLDSTTAASTYLTITTASTTYQPLDGDLTAIAGLSGTAGILTKTAANTWTLDTSTYLTTSVAASTYQPLDADLTAISGLTGNTGILTKTEANTWSLDTNTYLTTTAAAATYQLLDADLTAIAVLSGTAGLLRKTAADTWSLDTSVYLIGNETITLSGDATGSGTTAITVTLANSGVTAGSYGSATAVPAITFDAKGRTTQATSTPIQIAESQVTNLPDNLASKLAKASNLADITDVSAARGNLEINYAPLVNIMTDSGRFGTTYSAFSVYTSTTAYTASTLSLAGLTGTISDSAGLIPTSTFAAGTLVTMGGWSNAANNLVQLRVSSVSATTLVLEGDGVETLVDETAGRSVTLTAHPLTNSSGLITPYYATQWFAGKYIYNNITNGGTRGAIAPLVMSHMVAMGRLFGTANARYGIEFGYVGFTATGSVESTYYQMTINNDAAWFGGMGNYLTKGLWVRCLNGSARFTACETSVDGGNYYVPSGNLVISDNNWHHYKFRASALIGQLSSLGEVQGTPGTKVVIALPAAFPGIVPAAYKWFAPLINYYYRL